MIDFYRKADERRLGEMDFVADEIEEKFMLLLVPARKKPELKKQPELQETSRRVSYPAPARRVFCDVFYQQA